MSGQWLAIERSLSDEIDDLAVAFDQRREDGEVITQAALFRMDRYQSLMRQLRVELTDYEEYADETISGVQRSFGVQGIDQAGQLIRMQYPGVAPSFDRLPISVVENMVGLAGDGSPLTDLLRARMGDAVTGLTHELITGTALGRNPRDTARHMMRNGMSQGLNGALNIARTEQLRVYRQTSQEQYQAADVVYAHVRVATHDDRVCPACIMAEGEILRPDEAVYDHPQGRCTSIPLIEGLAQPQFQNGQDWFKQQDTATQRKILGPGRYNAWKDGEFDLDQLVTVRDNATWGKSLQPTPLKDVRNAAHFNIETPTDPGGGEVRRTGILGDIDRNRDTPYQKRLRRRAEKASDEFAKGQVEVKILAEEVGAQSRVIRAAIDDLDAFELNTPEWTVRRAAIAEMQTERDRVAAEMSELSLRVRSGEHNKRFRRALYQPIDERAGFSGISQDAMSGMTGQQRNGARFVERMVHQDAIDNPNGIVFHHVRLPDGERAFARRNTIHLTEQNGPAAAAHEIGHALEFSNSNMLERSAEFLRARAGDEKSRRLYDDNDDEIAIFDAFISPYTGKIYTRTGSLDDEILASEILSTGIQQLHNDPVGFFEKDPEMFEFVTGLLRGQL